METQSDVICVVELQIFHEFFKNQIIKIFNIVVYFQGSTEKLTRPMGQKL